MTKELQGFCKFFSFTKHTNFLSPFRAFRGRIGNVKKMSIFSDKKITKIRRPRRIFDVFPSLYYAHLLEHNGAGRVKWGGRPKNRRELGANWAFVHFDEPRWSSTLIAGEIF
jgi:hypothetical protein